ncbi:acyl-CoA dehydrogenase family protein [Sneathiella aquimaris]|uniref:acyl-CoA dehydrogenase family protein n=1 Tax=Sneathiella aquimaris TaxID=2599305 RepID=UPI00146A963C|nr:acyl-CoA dehydrogenase family protein [Sneathiella aquimaris]
MIYGPEHKEFMNSLSKFIDQEINPYVDQWEEEGIFPAHDLFKKMGDQGFLGVCKPEEYGGAGLDYSFSLAMSETLGKINCGAVPMAIGVQTDMATPALARFGSDYVKENYLRHAISGEYVACIGVSEPGAGSDVAGIKSNARKDGDDYLINGQKMWITNGTQADFMCMLVNTSDGPIHSSKSLIVVPMDTPGITVERKLDKLGMRSSDTAQLYFDNVRVPQRNIIGEEGMGFTYQMLQFQEERLWAAGAALQSLDKVIDDTIDYTRQREAFGKPLLDNQVIHFRLAELKTEVELLRALTYRAVEEYVAGENVTMLASMAKLKTGRLTREVNDACLQYYGGMGFMNETHISRAYRDGRLTSIGGGADEVMLGIICKLMDTLPSKKRG